MTPHIARKYRDIHKEFNKLSRKKKHGIALYRSEAIYNMLAFRFYLCPSHVYNILSKPPPAEDKAPNQLEIEL